MFYTKIELLINMGKHYQKTKTRGRGGEGELGGRIVCSTLFLWNSALFKFSHENLDSDFCFTLPLEKQSNCAERLRTRLRLR